MGVCYLPFRTFRIKGEGLGLGEAIAPKVGSGCGSTPTLFPLPLGGG